MMYVFAAPTRIWADDVFMSLWPLAFQDMLRDLESLCQDLLWEAGDSYVTQDAILLIAEYRTLLERYALEAYDAFDAEIVYCLPPRSGESILRTQRVLSSLSKVKNRHDGYRSDLEAVGRQLAEIFRFRAKPVIRQHPKGHLVWVLTPLAP